MADKRAEFSIDQEIISKKRLTLHCGSCNGMAVFTVTGSSGFCSSRRIRQLGHVPAYIKLMDAYKKFKEK